MGQLIGVRRDVVKAGQHHQTVQPGVVQSRLGTSF
jgi:hypothetical protein